MFTIDITNFAQTECMRDYSASMAELGQDAGPVTWQASLESVADWQPLMPENFDDFRSWVESSGGWTREEIDAWPDSGLQALCLQWIAGDLREIGITHPDDLQRVDWARIRADQENGRIPSSVYHDDSGRLFWECAQ